MKLYSCFLLAFSSLMPALASEKSPVTVGVGEEFDIKLESNLTEGWQWLVAKPLDPKLLKFVRVTFKRPTARGVSAKGSEALTFKALGEGRAEVYLKYGPLWEKNVEPTQRTNFVVQVTRIGNKQQK